MQRSWRTMQRSNSDMHKLSTGEGRQTGENIWTCVRNVDDFVTEEGRRRKEASCCALKTRQLESCTGKCVRYISVA